MSEYYDRMNGPNQELEEPGDLETIYSDPAVRDRIFDYLGGTDYGAPTALCLARCDGRLPTEIEYIPIGTWKSALETPGNLARSLADRVSLIVHLDVEYVNFDLPEEAYVNPWRAFRLQEPVITVIEEELSRCGIRPLHLLTGQGHHFVWKIPLDSDCCRRLAGEINLTGRPDRSADSAPPGNRPEDHAEQSFRGLGLLMEFLAHRIKQLSASKISIPVDITAVETGVLETGTREIISIDISEYGDPLAERIIRIPFTHYEKPWLSGMVERLALQMSVPNFVTLPLHEIDVARALVLRQTSCGVIALARKSIVRIPNQERGMSNLIEKYLQSPLRLFHEDYYRSPEDEAQSDSSNDNPSSPAAFPSPLPPCVSHLLTYPNDLLLKPAGLQLITRFLIAGGWHPRRIARLVQRKFEDPAFGWMPSYWEKYSPEMRADFYIRLFSGQILTGLDEGIDFNCVSTQERHFCPHLPCSDDLSAYRKCFKTQHS